MNRTTVSRRVVASVVLAAAGLGLAAVPAAAQEGTGTVTGTVWFDRDSDRTQDAGEPGRANALVEVRQGGALVETHRADGDGRYTITGLAPGDYALRNASAYGYLSTTPSTVNLTVAGADKKVNFGMKGGRIAGTAWRDNNGDGVRQSVDGAMAMSGSEVQLEAIMFGTTRRPIDAQGRFVFEDLPNLDTYRLYAPDRSAAGDEFTVPGAGSVIEPGSGASAEFAVTGNQTVDVGVGYRLASVDMDLEALVLPTAAKVGEEFTVTGRITNHGTKADHFGAQVRLPRGVRGISMAGLTRTPNVELRLFNGVSDLPLAPGETTSFSFTAIADTPVDANFWMGAGPGDLRDWNTDNNTREAQLVVTAAGSTTTPSAPAAQPVVNEKTPAAKTPATHAAAEVKDLASTGASPVLPLVLGSVLLAAGGSLLFVLRRRAVRG